MTTTTLRPNSTVSGIAADAAWSDDNDSTRIFWNPSSSGSVVHMAGLSLPAGAVTIQAGSRVRAQAQNTGSPYCILDVFTSINGSRVYPLDLSPRPTTAPIQNYSGPTAAVIWSQSDINTLQIDVHPRFGSGGNSQYVYELYLDVVYAPPPTVSGVGPTGTATTSYPIVSWTYTAGADGGGQTKYQVKVFDAATYGAGGFDPSTATATFDSGVVASSATSLTAGPLSNTDYRAYVQVAATTQGIDQWSAWAYSSFTVAAAVPPSVMTRVPGWMRWGITASAWR